MSWKHLVLRRLGVILKNNARPQRSQRGMSLVEIMVVVVIIGLVTSIVGVAVFNQLERARVRTAETQIKQMGDAVELYKLTYHSYPSTAEGLQALVTPKSGDKPIMNSVPKDPWDRDYVYIYPGSSNASGFDIMSYGPDGVQSADDVSNSSAATAAK